MQSFLPVLSMTWSWYQCVSTSAKDRSSSRFKSVVVKDPGVAAFDVRELGNPVESRKSLALGKVEDREQLRRG